MLYCPKCHIKVVTNTTSCPLCQGSLEQLNDEPLRESYPLPIKHHKKRHLLFEVLSYTLLTIILIVFLINFLTWRGQFWSLIVVSNIIYSWSVGLFSFMKRFGLGLKIFLNAFSILLLLVIINLFTNNYLSLTWAITYGIPIVSITFISFIFIIMFMVKSTRHDLWLYLIILSLIAFVPIITYLFGAVDQFILGSIAAGIGYLSLLGLVIFKNRLIKTEFIKKFHI